MTELVRPSAGNEAPAVDAQETSDRLRLLKVLICVAVPIAVWFAPIAVQPNTKAALSISAFMIIAWMTNVMEYALVGLVGLFLFWSLNIAAPAAVFSGFVNEASWFYVGAMLIGATATKAGLPQRIGNFVVRHVGVTYPRLLLAIIIIDFLLTFIVPAGAAIVVIMASVAIGVMNVFGVKKGSNIGRGLFLLIAYTTSIFNKMIIAGTASIISRGIMASYGNVSVSWALWFAAFLPCALVTVLASWWITLKLFPPEVEAIRDRTEQLTAHFQTTTPWTKMSKKAACLCGLALILWMTDVFHHISPSVVAFAVGLCALLPFVDVLNENDFKRINFLPFFFIAAALGMTQVLKVTGGLTLLTNTLVSSVQPLLANKVVAVAVLYWSGFVYHFLAASEISMLVTSMPVLMTFAKLHNLNAAWIGLIWSFSSGGKLFAYQSAVLVLGYSYGYFRHTDLIKLGGLLTVIEFLALTLSVLFYWPLLGLG